MIERESNNLKNLAEGTAEALKKQQYARRVQQGYVHLATALADGTMHKIAWDVYRNDADGGSIWTTKELDGDTWLVAYTDEEDNIVRGVLTSISHQETLQKQAAQKTAVEFKPGDMVVVSAHPGSVTRRYNGAEGEVIASYPDKSQILFKDDYKMWIEHKDLAMVRAAGHLGLNDTVRLRRNRHLSGPVTKIESGKVYFKAAGHQTLVANFSEIEKITKTGQTVIVWTEDPKMLKTLVQGPSGGSGGPGSPGFPDMDGGLHDMSAPAPPGIKAMPTPQEKMEGTSVSAKEATPQTVQQVAESILRTTIYGRSLQPGDEVLNKESGLVGTINHMENDRKLGKIYWVDYGQGPEQTFETVIVKTDSTRGYEQDPMTKLQSLNLRRQLKIGQGVPGMETLRGGGGGSASNDSIKPMEWEVNNEGEQKPPMAPQVDFLKEEMESPDLGDLGGDGAINISVNPKIKQITIDYGQYAAEGPAMGEAANLPKPGVAQPVAPPPGAGAGNVMNQPQVGGGTYDSAQTQFGQQNVGVEF